jgi:hypothetical protein
MNIWKVPLVRQVQSLAISTRVARLQNARNPDTAEANAVIICTWNEFDKGGWLDPTLSEGSARLDALQISLK